MTKCAATFIALAFSFGLASASAETPATNPIPVTVENFVRAETDMFFALSVKDGARSENFIIDVRRWGSTTSSSCAAIATRSIR
jgi:hypothetical protein